MPSSGGTRQGHGASVAGLGWSRGADCRVSGWLTPVWLPVTQYPTPWFLLPPGGLYVENAFVVQHHITAANRRPLCTPEIASHLLFQLPATTGATALETSVAPFVRLTFAGVFAR